MNRPSSVTRARLSNGLTVHLKEIHTAPLISSWVWYRVGSRNERPGKTGISHWVEHMQFKGTPRFPSGVLDRWISREGGIWNAFTYIDWTTYFETLPADKIDLALDLEADRMCNSLFDPEEVEAERTVILSEREGNENEPTFLLGEAVQMASFDSHPYRYEVIGLKEDLQRITRDDLYHHYQRYYHPANALITVAGDFETQTMLEKIEQFFGSIPAGEVVRDEIPQESPLQQERRLTVTGPGNTTYLQVAYRAPAANDPDFFAFTLLDSLLSGPSSLNMFGGGGVSNKTSRLYRALVERELAVSVGGGLHATIDPFLYEIMVTLRPGRTPEEALEAIDAEMHRLQDELVRDEEIQRALKQARAIFAYGSENITNQAFWLGFSEMFDSYQWYENYVERLAMVGAMDIQRIAQTFLQPQRRVVGVYQPTAQELSA